MPVLRRDRPGARLALVASIVAGLVLVTSSPATAHTPHDVVTDLEVSPAFAQDDTVFAIVREYLLRSDDGGSTWSRLVNGIDNAHALSAVEVSAADPQVLYVATRGDGVYRSEDFGRSWKSANGNLPRRNVIALTASPHSADAVVATAMVDGTPAVFTTRDAGASWTPVRDAGAAAVIAFAPDDPQTMFSGSQDGRVRLSRDGGTTWGEVFADSEAGSIRAITPSPSYSTDRTVYVGTGAKGAFVSTDAGESFTGLDHRDTGTQIESIALSPTFDSDSSIWISTQSEGPFLSSDRGRTWTKRTDGLTTNSQADDLEVPQFRQLRLAAAGSEGGATAFLAGFDGLFRTTDGDTWQEVPTQASTNIVGIAVSPSYHDDRAVSVAAYVNGAFLSRDGGDGWQAINNGLATEYEWTRAEDYVARLTGIVFSPDFAEDQTMFAGIRGYVLRSRDAGESWVAQSPPGLLQPDEFPADYVLPAFSPSYVEDRTILLGTDGGKVFRSTNAGASYEKVGQVDNEITAIVTSPAFATDRTLVAGTPAGIQLSTDAGATWEASGLADEDITSLAVTPDPAPDRALFAGTSHGLFVSTDAAASWTLVEAGALNDRSVVEAVAVSPGTGDDQTILVSLRGRGLYRSLDGGGSFTAVADALLRDNVVLSSFYHPTTEPIVFSPDFARDRTVFGIADTAAYRSTDGGETWQKLTVPLTTHDTSPSAAPSPLLPTARYGSSARGQDDDSSFSTPIGRLSAKRGGAAAGGAVIAFGLLTLLRDRAIGGRRLFRSIVARIACSALVLGAGLLVLAA